VHVLNKRGRWDPWFAFELVRVVRREAPCVLYGYSCVPNVVAVALQPLVRGLRIIWGVRASNMQLHRYGWLPPIVDSVETMLSHRPDLVIANSFAGSAEVIGRGYP